MPPFSEEARDLISKLLTHDPNNRISIPQIKNHPFFRMNLPDDYVTPTPIPFPNFVQPIDPSTVSPEIIDLLRKIGYNDDQEIFQDFLATTHSKAKVFYYMLTTRVSFDQLDWTLSVDASNPQNIEQQVIWHPANKQTYTVNGNDPFHRDVMSPSSFHSLDVGNSFADRPEWNVPNTDTMDAMHTYEIHINGLNLTELMRLVQITVRNLGMQWFFPDDFTILSRSEQIGSYIIFQGATLESDIDILLTLQLFQGTLEFFAVVCQGIEEIIGGNKAKS